jgi:deoxyribose-phosphate aldolase
MGLQDPTPPLKPVRLSWAGRRELTLAEFASHLEHRLYCTDGTPASLSQGCSLAVASGFAAVVCLPEHVNYVAGHVQGSETAVVTALGWHGSDREPLTVGRVLEDAESLAEQGATELALVATAARMGSADCPEFEALVSALVDAMGPLGVRVRAMLDTEHLDGEFIRAACTRLVRAGVPMVQGGSWRGERAGFSQIEVMRAALPPQVLLKWTQPVRSVDVMLLCIAYGVDRFNGDAADLMAAASRIEESGALTVPLPGRDY